MVRHLQCAGSDCLRHEARVNYFHPIILHKPLSACYFIKQRQQTCYLRARMPIFCPNRRVVELQQLVSEYPLHFCYWLPFWIWSLRKENCNILQLSHPSSNWNFEKTWGRSPAKFPHRDPFGPQFYKWLFASIWNRNFRFFFVVAGCWNHHWDRLESNRFPKFVFVHSFNWFTFDNVDFH